MQAANALLPIDLTVYSLPYTFIDDGMIIRPWYVELSSFWQLPLLPCSRVENVIYPVNTYYSIIDRIIQASCAGDFNICLISFSITKRSQHVVRFCILPTAQSLACSFEFGFTAAASI